VVHVNETGIGLLVRMTMGHAEFYLDERNVSTHPKFVAGLCAYAQRERSGSLKSGCAEGPPANATTDPHNTRTGEGRACRAGSAGDEWRTRREKREGRTDGGNRIFA
jgi:hypothetical protein